MRYFTISFLFLFANHTAFAQLNPAFTYTQSSVCIENGAVVINFFNTSTSSIGPFTSQWNFGDNTTSTANNPGKTYDKPGVYKVNLSISSAGQTASVTETIVIYEAPKIVFKVDKNEGCIPLKVAFTDQTSVKTLIDPDNGKTYVDKIISWKWDFGDNKTSIAITPSESHTYTTAGFKKVKLEVETALGCIASYITPNKFINVFEETKANFLLAPANSCQFPVTINASNVSTNGVSYTWSISGTSPAFITNSVAENAEITFAQAGTYNVKLDAIGVGGCLSSFNLNYVVSSAPVQNSFSSPDVACENVNILFTNTSNPDPINNSWSINGTPTSISKDLTYKFPAPGSYTIRLDALIGTCQTYSEKTIVVNASPTVDFNADVRSSCNLPLDVRFLATTSSDVIKRVWNFGDNITATELSPFKTDILHVYKGAGSFDVSVAVTNNNNCTITKIVPTFIVIQPPVINKSNLPDSGCAPFTIVPDIRFNGTVLIDSWKWTTTNANGDTINLAFGQNPGPQIFSESGRYKISLRIITNTGCEKDFSWPIKVGVIPTDFDFITTPTEACASLAFASRYTGGPVTGLKWKFSDGDSSFLVSPIKKFTKLGKYDVTLTASINGCSKKLEKINYLTVKGVIASFAALNDCSKSLEKGFSDLSTGNITKWEWDFGDGTNISYTAKVSNIIHVYSKTGQYNVKLKVSGDGCEFESIQSIFVTNESKINFDFSKLPLCVSDSFVSLLGIVENNKMIRSYDWNYGCGFTGPTETQNPRIDLTRLCNYSANDGRGDYPMQLKITDQNNCVYFSPVKNIFIGGPITDYAAISPTSGCKNLPVQFQDKSIVNGNSKIISRTWDFGDGSTPINISFGSIEHVFSGVGKFLIKLTLTDTRGCVSVKTKVIVNTTAPVFDFISAQIASCPGKDVQFQVNTTEILTSYVWDLGDGKVSFIANPKVSYDITSKKTIGLTIKDAVGCLSTLVKREYVEIGLPVAKFDVLKDTADCPPFNAEFIFDGSFVEKYEWDFGNGAVSDQPNPRNFYTKPGVFPVNLKVISPGGCIANATPRNIVLFGPRASINFNPIICEPFDAVFNITSPNSKYVLLDYGDGVIQDSLPYKTQYGYRYADTGYYQPKIFVENDRGCRVFIPSSLGIRAVGILPVFKSDINFYCENGTVKFTDLSLSNEQFKSWQWDFGDGGIGAGNTSSHFYNKPGLYNVKVKTTTLSGCSDSLTRQKMIEIQARPDMEIFSAKAQFCEEDAIQFEAKEITPNNSPVVKWFWDFTNGNSSDQKIPVLQGFRKAGSYPMRLYATNEKGCIDTVFKTYQVNPLPPIFAGIDTFLCLDKPIQLKPSGAATYEWTSSPSLSCINCIIPTVNPANNAVYIVKGTSTFGCIAYDSVAVKVVQPSKIMVTQNMSICIGESVQLNASGTEIVTWSPSTGLSGINVQSPIAKPTATSTYTATGKDSYGCFITTDNVIITINPNPTVNAGNDTTMMAGYPLQLKPTYSPDVVKVQWIPSNFLSCSDCKTPVSTPIYSTTYTVFAYTANNCMSKDIINVFATCSKENLFVPNTFSPNGDGSNEVFYPRGRGIQKIKSFKIFNRWGQLIHLRENFFANDQSAGWEGTKN